MEVVVSCSECDERDYDRRNPSSSLSAEEVEEFNERLRSDTHRLGMMLSTAVTGTAVFASMHWALVEFDRPRIATSDHPLVLWSGASSRSPQSTDITQIGIFDCIEVRLPVSPTAAVLMTWSDLPDVEHVRARGTRDHAANLNAFTVASAERQWFHQPGTLPASRERQPETAVVGARARLHPCRSRSLGATRAYIRDGAEES